MSVEPVLTITDAYRAAREASSAARAALNREEALLCAELAQYRKVQGMTQEQVSDLVGLSRTQITNIEAGRGVSVEALLAYAAVVGCRLVLQLCAERSATPPAAREAQK